MNIAILMPYRNAAKTIEESLASVKAQTYKNYLLVAVNNGSSDDSEMIVRNYCDKNLIPCEHLTNFTNDGAFSSALNAGLFWILGDGETAPFDAVARLDSDDIWHPEKLQKQVDFLRLHPGISILGTQIESFSHEFPVEPAPENPITDDEIRQMLFNMRNPIAHPSVMIRTNVFYRCGVYDDIYRHCEDYQYWMKASKYFKFANLPDVLVKYRIHHNPDYNPNIPLSCMILYGRAVRSSGE